MSNILEKGIVTELVTDNDFSYVFSDNSNFLPTEYKVMLGQMDNCYLKCMKVLYNGKIMLYYMPGQFPTLEDILKSVDEGRFLITVNNLFRAIIKTKTNGFLSCKNIIAEPNRIFVDASTLAVQLVYVPSSKHNFEGNFEMEQKIKSELCRLIDSRQKEDEQRLSHLKEELTNPVVTIETIYSELSEPQNSGRSGRSTAMGTSDASSVNTVPDSRNNTINEPVRKTEGKLYIVALNQPGVAPIMMTKDEFVLGKNPNLVDGVLSFNKAISRKHCKIVYVNRAYFLVDLESSNHTYINKSRLEPNKPYMIKNGDIIRLADSDFRIQIV